MATISLDRIDLGILRELQEDGRRSFREIARQLQVPEATVRARAKRLEENGVVRVLAFADPFKLGNTKMALLLVQVAPQAHETVVRTLEAWPEVSYLSTITGGADLCVQVLCGDDAVAIESVLAGAVGVISVSANVVPGILRRAVAAARAGDAATATVR